MMHSVQYDNCDIIIRLPRTALPPQTLIKLLEWLQLEEIRHISQL